MEGFISNYPGVVVWAAGIAVAIVLGFGNTLISLLLFFMKRAIDNLAAAIKELKSELMTRKEDITKLDIRLTKQEQKCLDRAMSCPIEDRRETQDRREL